MCLRSMGSIMLVFFFLGMNHGQAQVLSLDSLSKVSLQLVRDTSLIQREAAFTYLNHNLGDYIKKFPDQIASLEGLSVLTTPESNITLITYQLYRDTSDYRYGGWVVLGDQGQIIPLKDQSMVWEDDADIDYQVFDPESWYGVVYYQIQPIIQHNDRSIYALFGYDGYKFFTKRKILDFLVVEPSGVSFGAPLIQYDPSLPESYNKSRFILDFAVQAPATLRYDEQHQKIIFDHLMFMKSDIDRQGIMRVPDGTYVGFTISDNGYLVYEEKVFDQVLEEAPDGRSPSENAPKNALFGDDFVDKRNTKKRDNK